MKVKNCEKCKYHKRKTWSHAHYPKNYHAIGFTHAYAFCEKHNKRCLEVKKCEVNENG